MPNGSNIDYLFSETFRRLTLILGNTKNQKQREQIQLVIEGQAAIKKEHYQQIEQLKKASQPKLTDLKRGG